MIDGSVDLDGDYFFYYGIVDLRREIEADLLTGIIQDKRSMFYTRSYGAGIGEYENAPQGLALEVGMKYDIASWMARRNSEVSTGANGTRDRRAVTSQGAIRIGQGPDGVDVQVLYVPFFDYEKPGIVTVPMNG